MTTQATLGWHEVTKRAPCEICGKPDWCGRTDDGAAARCMRIVDAPPGWRTIKVCDKGGVVFRREGDDAPPHKRNGAAPHKRNGAAPHKAKPRAAESWPTLEDALAQVRHDQSWKYHDATGSPVGCVLRRNKSDGGKQILPLSRNDAGRWTLKAMKAPRPLYELPAILARTDETIFVCEGEKSADALTDCGAVATTSAGGSKAASETDWTPLRGRDVVIAPDADDAGEDYARDVARLAKAAGAKSIKVARLADIWPDIPKGGDIADALDADGPLSTLADDDVLAAIDSLAKPIDGEDEDESESIAWTPFPTDAAPRAAAELVRQAAVALQTDEGMIGPLALAAMSAAIGNSRVVRLSSSWTEPAIVWAVVVAPSGAGKTPALELVTRPIEERDRKAFRKYEEERKTHVDEAAAHERAMRQWQKSGDGPPPAKPEAPTCERFMTNDTTLEALAAMLAASPRGMLLASDELAAWLGGFTRYAGAGGRPGGEAARWLPMHRAESLKVDRKTSPPLRIERAALNIAGLIQPGVLSAALTATDYDSGLVARLLLAMPPTPTRRWSAKNGLSPTVEGAYTAMISALYALDMAEDEHGAPAPKAVTLDEEAGKVWEEYYNALNADMAGQDERTRAMLSKLEGGAARLALVVHLGRAAGGEDVDPDRIDGDSMRRGVALATWFRHEAERIYDRLGESEGDAEQRALIEWVQSRGSEGVTVRDLTKSGPRRYRNDREAAQAALDGLAESGRFRWVHPPQTGPGMPKAPRLVSVAPTIPSNPANPASVAPTIPI